MKVEQAKQCGEQVEKLQWTGHVWKIIGPVFIGCEKNKRGRNA